MDDLRPARLAAGERKTTLAMLQYQRESFVRKVSGVDDASARRSPVASGTTLMWLTKHVAYAEMFWIVRTLAGEDLDIAGDEVQPDDTLPVAIADYRSTWARTDPIIASYTLDATCSRADGQVVNLRWVLTHLLAETARHAGHADILRELIDLSVGR